MKYRLLLLTLLVIAFSTIHAQQKSLTLEDAIINRYRNLSPIYTSQLQWLPEGNRYSYSKDNTLYVKKVNEGEAKVLTLAELNTILDDSLKHLPRVTWIDTRNLFIDHNDQKIQINTSTKKITSRIQGPKNGENIDFSADANIYAYTRAHNLYVMKDGKEIAVSTDNDSTHVYGQAVSRYEFGISKGTFWSPDGTKLAYYVKDESRVRDYPIVDYMGRVATVKNIKYPMAGMESQTVSLGIYDVKGKKSTYIKKQGGKDDYLTNITWSPDGKVIYVHELNREQNHVRLNAFDSRTGAYLRTLYEEKSDTYVEPQHPIRFSKINPKHFYAQHNKDGYTHIYKYDTQGKLIHQLTRGEWEVKKLLGFDKLERKMYVTATKDSPLEEHIYSVETQMNILSRLSQKPGIHHGNLSSDGTYIIDRHQGPATPNREVILSTQGEEVETILDSPDMAKDYRFGKNEIVEIPSSDGTTSLYGRIILPTDFDSTKTYPVIVYVYGGPHSQMVKKSWKNSARWWQYYMADKGFIAFTLDNRGTINRGRKFEDIIHRQLGVKETEDQMAGIKYLKSLSYVDGDRIGVHGWSYGGFMTLNMMLHHPDVCKVGVAGGPVVDWSMYEIMYGERYMDHPNDNKMGYALNDMSTFVDRLQGKLMLIHGAQDDIVVMQHSMKFLRAAVEKGKQVDFFTYPTHAHNVRGMDRIHLMRKVSDYFIDNL